MSRLHRTYQPPPSGLPTWFDVGQRPETLARFAGTGLQPLAAGFCSGLAAGVGQQPPPASGVRERALAVRRDAAAAARVEQRATGSASGCSSLLELLALSVWCTVPHCAGSKKKPDHVCD
jgi:hypothetical protein